jgi:hypothetical protein
MAGGFFISMTPQEERRKMNWLANMITLSGIPITQQTIEALGRMNEKAIENFFNCVGRVVLFRDS